jgi:hypothetical protein
LHSKQIYLHEWSVEGQELEILKRFCVVADEVKGLAQEDSEMAKETICLSKMPSKVY